MTENGSLSYVVGAAQPPLLESTIGAFFDDAASRWADREALVVCHQNVRWTYAELQARVDALAANLLALGLARGDRIGIWSQNNSEWVLMQFATAKAGLILVNINPAYRKHELEYALNKVECRALVLAPTFKTSDYQRMILELAPEIGVSTPGALQAARLPELRWVISLGREAPTGMLSFGQLLETPTAQARAALDEVSRSLSPTDPINIQFTSGTTGAPKGATLSHRNILNNGYFAGRAMRLSEQDRLCIPLPLYHCFGMVLGNLASITHGACMVQPAEAFEPEALLQAVQAERCTVLHGVPTMFIAMLDHPRFAEFDLHSLRTGIMAGAPCPVEVMQKVIGRMHMEQVTIAYGMTETSPVSFQSACDDPVDIRVSTVGRIQPHIEAKVADPEGRTVPCGVEGELLVRGYSVMQGYWNDPEGTRRAIDNEGWMHSGDLGSIDAQGYCRILGRSKDMVIRGGENIYPREVEEFLYRHPKVLDVQCVGVPDARFGEELCACIVPQAGAELTAEEIRAFCKDQIAHYKTPRYVVVVDNFPMTVTGKIQKYLLREHVCEKLGLRAAG